MCKANYTKCVMLVEHGAHSRVGLLLHVTIVDGVVTGRCSRAFISRALRDGTDALCGWSSPLGLAKAVLLYVPV